MNTTTVAKSGAAAGAAYAFVVLLTGVLNHYKITITQAQSDAILTLVGFGIHAFAVHGWPEFLKLPSKAATPDTKGTAPNAAS